MSTIKTDIPCPECDANRVYRPLYAQPGIKSLVCWHCDYTEPMRTESGFMKDGIYQERKGEIWEEFNNIDRHVNNLVEEVRRQLDLKDTQIRTLADRLEKLEKWVSHQKEIKKFVGIEVDSDDIEIP